MTKNRYNVATPTLPDLLHFHQTHMTGCGAERQSRKVWQRFPACRARDRETTQCAGPDILDCRGRAREHHLHLPMSQRCPAVSMSHARSAEGNYRPTCWLVHRGDTGVRGQAELVLQGLYPRRDVRRGATR